MTDGITPSQTVGPFYSFALTPETGGSFSNDLTVPAITGQRIRIVGRVTDGDGAPIGDAIIEIWQADPDGRYNHPLDQPRGSNTAFTGFGRAPTNPAGEFSFTTFKPGAVPAAGQGPDGKMQAPHLSVSVFARGFLNRLLTRIYFPDEPANGQDPVLALVPAEARASLIATPEPETATYRFDIRVQGEQETVFFAC
jgi:protocatechuate 3,4-dioxygenase alpha subunit